MTPAPSTSHNPPLGAELPCRGCAHAIGWHSADRAGCLAPGCSCPSYNPPVDPAAEARGDVCRCAGRAAIVCHRHPVARPSYCAVTNAEAFAGLSREVAARRADEAAAIGRVYRERLIVASMRALSEYAISPEPRSDAFTRALARDRESGREMHLLYPLPLPSPVTSPTPSPEVPRAV